MIIELNLANLIFIVVASLSAVWALMKVIALQGQRAVRDQLALHAVTVNAQYESLTQRLAALDSAAKTDVGQWQRVERELLNLKADLPLHYVRREDYIRGQSVIEAKLDGIGMQLENVRLRALTPAPPIKP